MEVAALDQGGRSREEQLGLYGFTSPGAGRHKLCQGSVDVLGINDKVHSRFQHSLAV